MPTPCPRRPRALRSSTRGERKSCMPGGASSARRARRRSLRGERSQSSRERSRPLVGSNGHVPSEPPVVKKSTTERCAGWTGSAYARRCAWLRAMTWRSCSLITSVCLGLLKAASATSERLLAFPSNWQNLRDTCSTSPGPMPTSPEPSMSRPKTISSMFDMFFTLVSSSIRALSSISPRARAVLATMPIRSRCSASLIRARSRGSGSFS